MDLSRTQKITLEDVFGWYTRQTIEETLKIVGIPKKNLSVSVRQELVKFAEVEANDVYEFVEKNVPNSNSIISTLRGSIRKLMRWLEVDDKTRKMDTHALSITIGQKMIRDEIMSLTKKMLQGHEIKFFYQTKSCLKCKQPVDEGTGISSRRGVICDECDPDFKPKEIYTAESSHPRKKERPFPTHHLKKSFDKGH